MESIFHIRPFSEKMKYYEIHIFVQNSQKKSMESIFHIRPFSEKMKYYEIHIFVQNSQNLEFIKSLK